MANNEEYRFDVTAETAQTVKKLNEIYRLMDKIENIRNKGTNDYSTTNQKDMDLNIRSMSELTKLYRNANAELTELQRKMKEGMRQTGAPEGASKEQLQEIQKQRQAMAEHANKVAAEQQQLQSEYKETKRVYKELASFQQNASKNFKHIFSSNDTFNMPTDDLEAAKRVMSGLASEAAGASSKLRDVKAQIQEVNKLDRRSESLSRRAAASNYMSYQQASSFRGDYRTATEGYTAERKQNTEELAKIGQDRTRVSRQIKEIETNTNASQADIDRKVAMQQTVAAMDEEIKARLELDRVLERTANNMRMYNDRVTQGKGVEVKPERGTLRGMVYERSPAIGLAMGGAVAGVVGGLYSQGAQLNRSMRDDVISIGQHTGTAGDQWRDTIRDGALDAGVQDRLGFTGQEMLAFQQNYLSNSGFEGMDDLNTAMQNQARFSRSTGVDAETTKSFFGDMFSSGAVSGAQAKDIQDAFIGAIKQSGMEGREKDQLKALQGLLGSVAQGRTLQNQDVMNVMGMQSVLASSGSRALSGSQGGELMTNLNEGIRQGFNNPTARLIFGQGTEYQGLDGMAKLQEQMEKGISDPENIAKLARFAEGSAATEDGQAAVMSRLSNEILGAPMTIEQARGLMDLNRDGALTQDNLDKVLETDKATGKEAGDEKLQQYQSSYEATDNQSEATTAKQATELYDFGNQLREINAGMSGFNTAVYTATMAMGAFAATAVLSGGGFIMSRGVRKAATQRFGGGGGAAVGSRMERRGGGTGGGGGGFFSNAKSTIGGWFGRGGGAAAETAEAAGRGAASGGWKGKLGSAGNTLGKIMLPVGVAMGVGSVIAAPEDKKAEAIGGAVGGIGGGIAGGAVAGAALGSVVPGIGTAIGGVVGGIGGGIAGSKVGQWVGGWFGGDDKEAKAEEAKSEHTSKADKQTEKESTNTKSRAENKRADNIAAEKENLNVYESLLSRAESILNQARQQNGIFGTQASNSATGTVAATPLSGNSDEEKIWSFFAEKGFSSSAIAGIMGNLKQESQLDPNATNPTSGAYGIGQWLGGRKTGLQNYAKETGGDASSIETQLNYLWKEMQGGDSTFVSKLKKYGGMDALKGASVSDATKWFEDTFERSGGSAMGKRQDYAEDFYNKYGNSQMARSAASTATSSSAKVESTINVNVKGDEKVSDKVKDTNDLRKVAATIQDKIYGTMNFFSTENKRT
jgi:hypothetical protein